MCTQDLLLSQGLCAWTPEGDPWQWCHALCRALARGTLPLCVGDKCFLHPSLSLSSLPFLSGDLCSHPLISAQVPPSLLSKPCHEALQAPPGPMGQLIPSSPLLSHPRHQFSSLTISLLLQALPDPTPPFQAGFCPDTPRDWSGVENATLPCVFTPALLKSTFPSFGSSDPTRGLKTVGACYLSLCLFDFLGVGEFHPHKLLHCVKKI